MAEEANTQDNSFYTPNPASPVDLSKPDALNNSATIKKDFVRDQVVGEPPYSPDQLPKDYNPATMSNLLNEQLQKRASGAVDKNVYSKPYMYDASSAGAHKARYKAYGQKTYDRIGFNPEINNEEVFNANTSIMDDFIRMGTHSFGPMFGNGLLANPKSYGQLITGDIGQDVDSAEDYEEYNALGYSSKGGTLGFVNNLFNSVAYSAGVLTEAAAEYAAIGAIEGAIGGTLAGPGGTAAGGAVGGAVGGTIGAIKGLASLPKALWEMSKFGTKMVTNLKNLEKFAEAKRLFTAARTTTSNFINPINNATDAIRNADNLTGLARANKTAAGFFKDVVGLNAGWSEGRLEGGFVENNTYNKAYDQFWKKEGRAPSDQEQLEIRKLAKLAGFKATWKNGLLVTYSNKIAFPNLFKGAMKKGTYIAASLKDADIIFRPAVKDGAKTAAQRMAEGSYDLVERNLRTALQGLRNPGLLGKSSLMYFKTNLIEGTQEILQDVIAKSTEDYYVNSFYDPSKANFDYSMATLKDAFGDQANERGFETFASGFFMGGLLKPITTVASGVPKYASMKYKQWTMDPQKFEEYKAERNTYGQRVVDAMNRMHKGGADYLNDRMVNYGTQAIISKRHNDDDTTTKQHKDAANTSFVSDVLTSLSAGTFNVWRDNFKKFDQLNEKELEQAWDLEPGEGTKAKQLIADYTKKAESLQSTFNYTRDNVATKKINLSNLKKDSPEYERAEVYNKAIDRSIFNLLFMKSSFENNLERLNKMNQKWQPLDPKGKLAGADFQVITDPQKLYNRIEMLKTEIDSMKMSMEGGEFSTAVSSQIEEKQELLNDLTSFRESQEGYLQDVLKNQLFDKLKQEIMERDNLSENDAEVKALDSIIEQYKEAGKDPVENYKRSYENLLKRLSGDPVAYQSMINKITTDDGFNGLFKDIVDMHELDYENQRMIPYINILSDPGGFAEHVDRNFEWMNRLYMNRAEYYKDVVNKSIELKEYNDLLEALSDMNIYIDLNEFADWVEDHENLPSYFIDASTGSERIIPKGSMLYEKYIELFERVTDLQKTPPAGEASNLKEQYDTVVEERNQQMAKELDDAKTNFESNIKEEFNGQTLEELKAKEAEGVTTETVDEVDSAEVEKAIAKLDAVLENLNNDQPEFVMQQEKRIINDELIPVERFNLKMFDDLISELNTNEEKLRIEVAPIFAQYDPGYLEENRVTAAMHKVILTEVIEKEKEFLQQPRTITTTEPVIIIETSQSWKDYQAEVEQIKVKYKELIDQITADFMQRGMGQELVSEEDAITIDTPWENLPTALKNKLQPLFDQKIKDLGMDNLAQEDPIEYERIRNNWLREQGDLINEFNQEQGVAKLKADQASKVLTEPEFKFYKSDGKMSFKSIQFLRQVLDGLQTIKDTGKKLNAQNKVVSASKTDLANIDDDIQQLYDLIEKKTNLQTPSTKFDDALGLFKQRVEDRENEVEQVRDENGKVLERRIDGQVAERVTKKVDELDQELTPGKTPFVYAPLTSSRIAVKDAEGNTVEYQEVPSPVLSLYDEIVNDDSIKPEAKVKMFLDRFYTLSKGEKAYPAFTLKVKDLSTGQMIVNPKREQLEKELEEDFSKENVVKAIQSAVYQEAAAVGDMLDYLVKDFLTREGLGWKKVDKPDKMSQEAFDNLFGRNGVLTRFREELIDGGFIIIGASTLVFDKSLYENGLVGETDLIAVNDKGEFNIIDVKALKKGTWDKFDADIQLETKIKELEKEGLTAKEIDKNEEIVSLRKAVFSSKKQYFRLQQSVYRNLFFNMTGVMPKRIGLLPVQVDYDSTGYVKNAKLSELVPDGYSTIRLDYMPEAERIVPLKAPVLEVVPTTPEEFTGEQVEPAQHTSAVIEVSETKSNKLADNIDQTVFYKGRVGTLVLNSDGTFGVEIDNKIEDLYFEMAPAKDGKIGLENVGVALVTEIKQPDQIRIINNEKVDAQFLDPSEKMAMINGVTYSVNRNSLGNIVSLTYYVNENEISKLQEELSGLYTKIEDLRKNGRTESSQERLITLQNQLKAVEQSIASTPKDQKGALQDLLRQRGTLNTEMTNFTARQNTNIRQITGLNIEVEKLNRRVSELKKSNTERTLRGGNANSYIFALNSLPNSFQKQVKGETVLDQKQQLKEIANLSVASATATKIDTILMIDYPTALDRLLTKGVDSITQEDINTISNWANKTIDSLYELGFSIMNTGNITTDIDNQIKAINNLLNDLQLIKFNKDGKISKASRKKAEETFRPELPQGTGVSTIQEPGQQPTERISGQPTGEVSPSKNEMISKIQELTLNVNDGLKGIDADLGTIETEDSIASKYIAKIQKANTKLDLENILYDALQAQDKNPASFDIDLVRKIAGEKLLELKSSTVTPQREISDTYFMVKEVNDFDIPANTVVKLIPVNEDYTQFKVVNLEGTTLSMDGLILSVDMLDIVDNFDEIIDMEQPTVEATVSAEDKSLSEDSTQSVEEFLADKDATEVSEKEVEDNETKGGFRDKLKNRNCNI